jgi:CheY-like chemotaxis protein
MNNQPSTIVNKVVMLIDDNDIDNFINEKIINGCFFAENVYIHSSTISALEFLNKMVYSNNINLEHIPAYIFLDINMPIMDGFYFLEEFEKLPAEFKSLIKIIMLTSSTNQLDVEKAMKYKQVLSFLNKPLTEENLESLQKLKLVE